ncbi:hypothetical protein [Okeania sp. SIO2B3]|uniref:hypothetical protein n=1 Tax=Okeania sp. SIO2B3 TaxID=2607784 RepID=UPI0013BF1079|nr:hypothetical protein [Okeania sp. SIO2B3]NET46196.1 hypothetical protein [Okeania sp. SIO2B3]
MTPETIVTVGMISTFVAVICGSWIVFRYIGRIENQIKENASSLTNVASSSRERDRRLLREMKRHRLCVKDVENFLSKKLEFHVRPFIEMEENDF